MISNFIGLELNFIKAQLTCWEIIVDYLEFPGSALNLEQNGMEVLEIGNTYQADHAQSNGKIAESALDHI